MEERKPFSQLEIDFGKNLKRNYDINLNDDSLFGLDDAAHVDFDLLKSYSVNRMDCHDYIDESKSFMILCAPKGTGKTTLVRLWQNELANKQGYISIIKFDSQISPSGDKASYSKWIRLWKRNITLSLFHSLTDNKYSNISSGKFKFIETIGNRAVGKENFVDLITEYFHQLDEEIKTKLLEKRNDKIWIFIDEIDQYFTRTNRDILKMASLLTACRELTSYIPNLNIRTTIKPNVWAILRTEQSSMSNIKELVVKYKWNTSGIKTVIAQRIKSYIARKYYAENINTVSEIKHLKNEDWLINLIFDPKSDFDLSSKYKEKRNTQKIEPHKTLSQLGSLRPRWVLSLCKMVAENKPENEKLIQINHIKNVLPTYGQERIIDISSEFKTQCNQISEIINSFFKETSNYNNHKYLLDKINDIIIKKMNVKIIGVNNVCTAGEVANFLFEIGFIQPKNIITSHRYEFIDFETFPSLVESNNDNNISKDLMWEIHPSFRNTLSLDRQPVKITYGGKRK